MLGLRSAVSEISGNTIFEHGGCLLLMLGLRSAVSEISILFLFYVFEFIDMLPFGAYRFHCLAAVWVVDMAVQAGLLVFFFNVCSSRRMLQHVVFELTNVMRGRWSCSHGGYLVHWQPKAL